MADETIRLVAELDTAGVSSGAQQADRAWGQAVDRMNTGSRSVEAGADRIGQGYQRAAQIGQRSMQVMSAAIGASTAAVAAQERQWLSLGTILLGSFAAGGPIVGGIAAIAAGAGVLYGAMTKDGREFDKMIEGSRDRVKALQAEFKKGELSDIAQRTGSSLPLLEEASRVAEEYDKVRKSLVEVEEVYNHIKHMASQGGGGLYNESGDMIISSRRNEEIYEKRVANLKEELELRGQLLDRVKRLQGEEAALRALQDSQELKRLDSRNAQARMAIGGGPTRANEVAIQDEILLKREQENLLRHMQREMEADQIAEIIKREEQYLGVVKETNDVLQNRRVRTIEREIELLGARNEKERELIQLRHRGQDLLEGGNDANAVSRLIEARMQEINSRALVSFVRQADQTLSQGLSDIIVDGISNGFRDASNIAGLVWQSLLRQMVDDLVSSGLNGAIGSLFGGGGGGGGGSGILGIFSSIAGLFSGGGGGGGGGGSFSYGSGTDTFSGGGFESISGDPSIQAGPWGTGSVMAEGGIVTRPTRTLVGERGPEAVIPLHKMNQLGGGGISIGGITVNVSASDVKVAARMAAAEVERAILEKSSTRAAVVRATTRRL